MKQALRGLALGWLGFVGGGCDKTAPAPCQGAEACACYGNGSCDEGLECLSSLCVEKAAGPADAQPESGAVPSAVLQRDAATPSDAAVTSVATSGAPASATSTPATTDGQDAGCESPACAEPPASASALASSSASTAVVPSATASEEPPDAAAPTASATPAPVDASSEMLWSTQELILDGNDGWSAQATGGLNYDGHCLEFWGSGSVIARWQGPPAEHPIDLASGTEYRLDFALNLSHWEKFSLRLAYARQAAPEAPDFVSEPLALGADTLTGPVLFTPSASGPGAIEFRFDVTDATSPYGRACFESARLQPN